MTAPIQNFWELEAWKIAHELTLDIYRITKDFPKQEMFGIISQLRRASSSITANIAEGFARYHFKDKIRFYYQSRGSCAEVQNYLMLGRDLGYVSESDFNLLMDKSFQAARLLNGLIRATTQQVAVPVASY